MFSKSLIAAGVVCSFGLIITQAKTVKADSPSLPVPPTEQLTFKAMSKAQQKQLCEDWGWKHRTGTIHNTCRRLSSVCYPVDIGDWKTYSLASQKKICRDCNMTFVSGTLSNKCTR